MSILTNLLIVMALGAYLLFVGYILSGGIQECLKGYRLYTKEAEEAIEEYEVLIGGESELAISLEQTLKEHGIRCSRMMEPVCEEMQDVEEGPSWRRQDKGKIVVFALDDSDYRNLLMCGLARKLSKASRLYGICNDSGNRRVFLENRVKILETHGVSAEGLYRIFNQQCRGRGLS